MNNEKSLYKILSYLILGIMALWFINAVLIGLGTTGYHGGGHEHMGYGIAGASLIGTTSFILLLLIKILFILFIVSFVVGIMLAVKKYIFTEEDLSKIKGTFTRNKNESIKKSCTHCGQNLNEQWKACPFCGNAIEDNIA